MAEKDNDFPFDVRKSPVKPTLTARDLIRGRPFFFSSGSYSDYCVNGVFIPLETIPAARLLELNKNFNLEMQEILAKEGWIDGDAKEMFIARLIKEGLLMEVVTPEIWLGDSSESILENVFASSEERLL